MEAAFKTKRGSKVCRRCDYCLKNYGKPKPCQKCKVKAAWDGAKIEKINDLVLCFICSFREKRKSKLIEAAPNNNKVAPEKKSNTDEIPNTPPSSNTPIEKPSGNAKPKPIDPTVIKKRFI